MPSEQSLRTILVVDDQGAVCETVAMILRSQGYVVYTASSGLDAINRLRSTQFDLVISDLSMPEISGFEVIAAVRSWFPATPVVAMSGAYQADSVPQGVAFYSKGEGPELLLAIVEELLSRQPKRDAEAARKV
jgi:CheY-like chemotaxis protein